MSAIAGMFDLVASRMAPAEVLTRMAAAMAHRGPAQQGHDARPGIGLAWRGSSHEQSQPVFAENGAAGLVCDGRLFNYAELRAELNAGERQLRTTCNAEPILHLWQAHGKDLFQHLRGQFAFALWDRDQRLLILARDRVGMVPLYWARGDDGWLLFSSEIRGLFASGLIRPQVDRRGIDHVFTFLGLPAARTCFAGVSAVLPGHCLSVQQDREPTLHQYWDLDFPDRGQERDSRNPAPLAEELESKLQTAIRRRLNGDDGRVACYISGGIDCSTIAALARETSNSPVPTFTIRLKFGHLDESDRALRAAQAAGSEPAIVSCGTKELLAAFPRVIRAAECPVADPSSASLLLLAERVHHDGYGIALGGDGADDLFAGYPWFRINRVMSILDIVPGVPLSQWLRRLYLRWSMPQIPWANVRKTHALVGGHHAWLDLYGLVAMSRARFYSADMREALGGHTAYEDLTLNLERMRHWHPLNQDLYLGVKLHLGGMQLQTKGDRVAMHSSVQPRWPFLDEDVMAFSAGLHPHWKLRRLRDKYLLRKVAERRLPADIAWRPKSDFVAPFDSLYGDGAPAFVEQLLSAESLGRTGYFDATAVHAWRRDRLKLRPNSGKRISVEIGLSNVVATQMWHQMFIDPSLADMSP